MEKIKTEEAERLELLGSLQRSLKTQDNRGTENPMFCVRGRRRIYGMDPEFTDNTVWMDSENGVIPCEAPADGQETEFITKTAYLDIWDTLMVAFTEAGCKRHLELNGHNYDNYEEVQIYVKSFNRCPEMVSIREMLASGDLAALQTRLASAEQVVQAAQDHLRQGGTADFVGLIKAIDAHHLLTLENPTR